jgi:ferredoxin
MADEAKPKKKMIVNAGACMACGYCEDVCPTGAIRVVDVAHIDQSLCIACGCCAGRCPMGAID